ncbi:hypothetical protein QWZ06_17390 [Chryseobacterium tructae]|uniref:Uncharacterized protein n=1 Tax=Chryseobacterium tructae TaxID=1037380 RepID=A0ABV7XYX7_9FLAO|nr:hypothetical protein [Chryseobacterium tructae]MDN3693923.1 hypothetical protein [Chryseobacterium tructae]
MMKNNPFLTVFLLFCIKVLLIYYLDYIDFGVKMGDGLSLAVACFFIPGISVFLTLLIGESKYKKGFKYFTFFMVGISILVFITLSFLGALGRSFNH